MAGVMDRCLKVRGGQATQMSPCHPNIPMPPSCPHTTAWERQQVQTSLQSPPKPPLAFHTAVNKVTEPPKLINTPDTECEGRGG